jgi:septal ring factor EnvC (AmiA/AmiB activator)
MRRSLAALCLLACGVALAQNASSPQQAQRRLEQVRAELQRIAREQRETEGRRGEAVRALREADEAVGARQRELSRIEAELAIQRERLDELGRQAEDAGRRLQAQRAALATWVRAAYRGGRDEPLRVLLAQDQIQRGRVVLGYYGYLQRDRQRRIAALAAELAGLRRLREDIRAGEQRLAVLLEQQRAQVAAVAEQRRARRQSLRRIETQAGDQRQRQAALETDARALRQLLQRLQRASAQAAPPARAATPQPARPAPPVPAGPATGRGQWPLPVAGSLLAGFGARLPDGRNSEGWLIGAAAGTPVRAVAAGRVAYADWLNGYGLLLILDHGGGVLSLYAFNDALLKNAGDAVAAGEVVATVGSSAAQGRPALYFEVRRNGQPQDPRAWLGR